jgi:hypothetical protein
LSKPEDGTYNVGYLMAPEAPVPFHLNGLQGRKDILNSFLETISSISDVVYQKRA